MNIWGIIGIIAAVAVMAGIFVMIYRAETKKQKQADRICENLGHLLNPESCSCKRCGKEEHDWDGCLCPRCKKIRDEQHDWHKCVCARCGSKRDEQHDFEADESGHYEICRLCGKIIESDGTGCDHEWVKTNISGVAMVCKKCGKEELEE